MPAIAKTVWTIESNLDISNLSDTQIIDLFNQKEETAASELRQQHLTSLNEQRKARKGSWTIFIDRENRLLFTFREMLDAPTVDQYREWCIANNTPTRYPETDQPFFINISKTTIADTNIETVWENLLSFSTHNG